MLTADKKMDNIEKNYVADRVIGKGSYGEVYLCHDSSFNKYAIKVEKKDSDKLLTEFQIYKKLKKRDILVPSVYEYIETEENNALVMDLLGDCLDTLFTKKYKNKFDVGTILLLGINLTTTLEKVHESGFIHRDIKPNNFLIGRDINNDKVYLTDFGLTVNYIIDGEHIKATTKKKLIGTLRYASINIHVGMAPSRRDDMESLAYMLIYFARGSLPWQGLKNVKSGEAHKERIGEIKIGTSVKSLCNGIPSVLGEYLELARGLKFAEKPNYNKMRQILYDYADNNKIDLQYQWIMDMNKEED